MVERNHAQITIKRQADLLGVNRTSVYRPSKEQRESEENVQIMHRIDEISKIPTEMENFNPVQNSYAALWAEYRELNGTIPTMNVIRRILEYYFM